MGLLVALRLQTCLRRFAWFLGLLEKQNFVLKNFSWMLFDIWNFQMWQSLHLNLTLSQ